MTSELFPPIEPYLRDVLDVGDGHRLCYELSGNPAGPAVLFLHGGPGSPTRPVHRRFFDPGRWRIVLFDQRGCGASTPLGALTRNDTPALVQDIERLRARLGIERWLLFGGSWGSTLALAYAGAFARRVAALVLRGVFLASREELDWYLVGLRRFLPEAWQSFADSGLDVPVDSQRLLARYHAQVVDADGSAALAAARRWETYESTIMAVGEAPAEPAPASSDPHCLAQVRVQLHYLVHDCFLRPGELLHAASRLRDIPAIIVQGRRDLPCPPVTAQALARRWRGARLRIVEAGGHSALHPAMLAALLQAVEDSGDAVR